MSTDDGKPAGLYKFLDWAGRTGEMNATTARAWSGTARQVLELAEEPELDLRTLDAEALFKRFETLNRTKYSSGSMNTYRTRFTRAVESYVAYLNDDPGWRPGRRTANGSGKARGKKNGTTNGDGAVAASTADTESVLTTSAVAAPNTPRLVTYQLPLRPDMLVRLDLPVDLTRHDAERVAAFVRSLAFDDSRTDGQSE